MASPLVRARPEARPCVAGVPGDRLGRVEGLSRGDWGLRGPVAAAVCGPVSAGRPRHGGLLLDTHTVCRAAGPTQSRRENGVRRRAAGGGPGPYCVARPAPLTLQLQIGRGLIASAWYQFPAGFLRFGVP